MSDTLKARAGTPYRPSNGIEGELFEGTWCADCTKKSRCRIWDAALCFGLSDPEYPKQLVYGEDGQPKCTGHKQKGSIPKRMHQKGPGLFDIPKPRDLRIPVKSTYFAQIKSGTKTEEYRLCTPYWKKRKMGIDGVL